MAKCLRLSDVRVELNCRADGTPSLTLRLARVRRPTSLLRAEKPFRRKPVTVRAAAQRGAALGPYAIGGAVHPRPARGLTEKASSGTLELIGAKLSDP